MPEIYIQSFIAIVVYIVIMRLASGGEAFRTWNGFFGYHIPLIVILLALDACSGGEMFGVIKIIPH